MRTLFFCLFLLPFAQTGQQVNAQSTYIPFATEGARWVVEDYCGYAYNLNAVYEISGDSTINGQDYKIMLRWDMDYPFFELWQAQVPPYLVNPEPTVVAFIRDDIPDRKVYARIVLDDWICSEGNEELLYDFDLEVGDSLSTCLEANRPIAYSASQMAYGRMRLHLSSHEQGFDPIIEAVGGQSGPLRPYWACFVAEGLILLKDYCENPDDPACAYSFVSSVNDVVVERIRAYPNPAESRLNLVLPKALTGKMKLEILTAQGQLVYSEDRVQAVGQKCSIEVNHLPKGAYVVRLINTEQMAIGQFIKS